MFIIIIIITWSEAASCSGRPVLTHSAFTYTYLIYEYMYTYLYICIHVYIDVCVYIWLRVGVRVMLKPRRAYSPLGHHQRFRYMFTWSEAASCSGSPVLTHSAYP